MTAGGRPWLTTWSAVIEGLAALGPDDFVCFDGGPNTPTDPCLVADGTNLNEDEDVPPEAAERGWNTVLGKDDLRGILTNLARQVDNPDLTLILRAVAHYVDNDAYITVG